MHRVVVTGIGPIVHGATGKDEFWDMLINKKASPCEIPPQWEEHYKYKSRFYIPAPVLEKTNQFIDNASNIAVHSARLAVYDSMIENVQDFGVILGIGMGDLQNGLTSFKAHVTGEGRFNRMVIPSNMASACSANVAIDLGTQNFAYTVNTACSSGNTAIGEAYMAIKHGRAKGIITGGVECLDDGAGGIMRGFDVLTTLTKSCDGLPKPFSQERSGFLMNLGAGCVVVLEELEYAKSRGAKIYAEIVGYAHNNDSHSLLQMQVSGEKIEQLFNIINPDEVDYINAHGTATLQNDELEADIIKRVFGEKQPIVNSSKGIIGHSIGASAALEFAVCCLSIKNNTIHGNLTSSPFDGLNLPLETIKTKVDTAINCSYGFGGHNTLLALRKYND